MGISDQAGRTATHLTEGSQNNGVAFTLEDGVDDGRATESIEVAEYMMKVEVHFGERFLHELDLARGVGDEVAPMPEQGAQGDNVVGGAETFAQDSIGVELLEPLGVDEIDLFAGHAFDMAGIDKKDLDVGFFENALAGNPEAETSSPAPPSQKGWSNLLNGVVEFPCGGAPPPLTN